MKLYLGVDLGTSSMKILLVNKKGEVLKKVQEYYEVHNFNEVFNEQNPLDWWNSFLIAFKKISEEIIVDIKNKSRLTIIEGTYSFSRNINLNSDLDIFLILTKEEELERLKIRENESNYNNFLNIWMKLERNYFSSLKPKNNDLIIFKCSKEDASISNESK